jgi:hypothetical protein
MDATDNGMTARSCADSGMSVLIGASHECTVRAYRGGFTHSRPASANQPALYCVDATV